MINSVVTSSVKTSTVISITTADHQSNNDSQNICYSCVDEYQIPPCAGFSQDYSCLPSAKLN